MLRISFLLATLQLLILASALNGQKSDFLPPHKDLSFNGKFINQLAGESFKHISDNGLFACKYVIGKVSDENREIMDFEMFENEKIVYTKQTIPGADVLISNSGNIAVFDKQFHFIDQLTIHFFGKDGKFLFKQSYKYASLFGFSPSGDKFVIGTDQHLQIINLITTEIIRLDPCSKFAFSRNESLLATAREDILVIYENYQKRSTIYTSLFYPRALIVSDDKKQVAIIGKRNLKIYAAETGNLMYENIIDGNLSYRDLYNWNNLLLAGVHYKYNGISKGIMQVFGFSGELVKQEEIAEKQYQTFENKGNNLKSTNIYDPIPWPFFPFDDIHKVWNHYEQHMGDGSGYWSYLHQGLDIEVPINEPTYAVEAGWVKCVLTLGGSLYWRLAISPVQSSGFSNGWLYAHLVESSIQVDVGDYVDLHDYLGDIIYWANDWGHIHFVNIKDYGQIWYYDDDEWGINFNPLLALTPNSDSVPPVIENFSTGSKFGYYINETDNYLDPDSLYGDIDIVVKISEYHANSEWEQPAYKTYYWLNKLPEDTTIFPKTLGQVLNHAYPFYESSNYYPYADILYKKDYLHPSPPWMNWNRDYWQILTNNNGDSIIDLSEAALAFPTADYPDGDYRIFVEAWDEAGNMALDSQDVKIDNLITNLEENKEMAMTMNCYPNPVFSALRIRYVIWDTGYVIFDLYDISGKKLKSILIENRGSGSYVEEIELGDLIPGIYFCTLKTNIGVQTKRIIKL